MDPSCVRIIKRPISGRDLGHVTNISKFWYRPCNFWTNRDIRFKFGTDIQDAPLRRANHKKWPLSGRGLGHVTKISKFWDSPYDFWTNRDIHFKFGKYIEDGPLLRPDHKTTPKWARPGSRDQISKFWDSL